MRKRTVQVTVSPEPKAVSDFLGEGARLDAVNKSKQAPAELLLPPGCSPSVPLSPEGQWAVQVKDNIPLSKGTPKGAQGQPTEPGDGARELWAQLLLCLQLQELC